MREALGKTFSRHGVVSHAPRIEGGIVLPEPAKPRPPDLKVRSWGASAQYGINPISEAGQAWVENWLMRQPFVYGMTRDGAVTYCDSEHGTVYRSVKEHGLTASAGIGPDPAEGEPYWR